MLIPSISSVKNRCKDCGTNFLIAITRGSPHDIEQVIMHDEPFAFLYHLKASATVGDDGQAHVDIGGKHLCEMDPCLVSGSFVNEVVDKKIQYICDCAIPAKELRDQLEDSRSIKVAMAKFGKSEIIRRPGLVLVPIVTCTIVVAHLLHLKDGHFGSISEEGTSYRVIPCGQGNRVKRGEERLYL